MCASPKVEVLDAVPQGTIIPFIRKYLCMIFCTNCNYGRSRNKWRWRIPADGPVAAQNGLSARGSIEASWLEIGWLCSDEPRGRQIKVNHIPPFWVQ